MSASGWAQAAARTIVFCNKIETCRKVENLLNRGLGGASSGGGALVLAHHAAIDEAVRQRNLKVREHAAAGLSPLLCALLREGLSQDSSLRRACAQLSACWDTSGL